MENKKNPNANLEKFRLIFFEMGLIISLLIIICAFRWSSVPSQDENIFKMPEVHFEEEIIPVTKHQDFITPPPKIKAPPPQMSVTQITEHFEIVKNDSMLKKDVVTSESEEKSTNSQTQVVENEESESETPYFIVEDMPQFPGGEVGLRQFIAKNIRYPEEAEKSKIQGIVEVQFLIQKNGEISDVKIIRSVHPLLDEEALRIIKLLPSWEPGKQRGKPVKVLYMIPLSFRLQ